MEQHELIVAKPNGQTEIVPAVPTPMELLQMAVQKGVDIDQLTKLMDLQERWEKAEAKRKFEDAMAEYKKQPPRIEKNKVVRFETSKGITEYRHATLDNVTEKIQEALSKVGVRHRWVVEQGANGVTVTCVLSGFGHEERTTLSAPPDTSGTKNSIQAVASTVSYLERYTLLAATGSASYEMDDDAGGMDADWMAEQLDWFANARNPEELQKLYTQAFRQARSKGDHKAMNALIEAKDKRKKELAA